MNKITKFSIIIITSMLIVLSAYGQNQQDDNTDLIGEISKPDLRQEPYAAWFNPESEKYTVDRAALADLSDLLKGVEVKIIMGTWCHDSKREVPRMYKILEGANLSADKVAMIALDRKKQAPDDEIDGMGITNTPTFIFYRDGRELNRIVEKPVESLEKDMVKILENRKYRHSKMP